MGWVRLVTYDEGCSRSAASRSSPDAGDALDLLDGQEGVYVSWDFVQVGEDVGLGGGVQGFESDDAAVVVDDC